MFYSLHQILGLETTTKRLKPRVATLFGQQNCFWWSPHDKSWYVLMTLGHIVTADLFYSDPSLNKFKTLWCTMMSFTE